MVMAPTTTLRLLSSLACHVRPNALALTQPNHYQHLHLLGQHREEDSENENCYCLKVAPLERLRPTVRFPEQAAETLVGEVGHSPAGDEKERPEHDTRHGRTPFLYSPTKWGASPYRSYGLASHFVHVCLSMYPGAVQLNGASLTLA